MKSPLLNSLLVLLQFVIVSLTYDDRGIMDSKRRTSNVCRDTSECPTNAICEPRSGGVYDYMEGQCVCRNGYFMKASGKSRECIEIADYGELCYMNEQCEFRLGKESFCNNGQCSCKSNSHYVITENACFNSSKIGEYCRLTSNCVVDKTTCQQGQCRCFRKHHPNLNKSKCLRDINLNEQCFTDDECVVENSHCMSGTCQCKSSHVRSEENDQLCLPLATSIYQSCQQDMQCSSIPNAVCESTNGTCVCQKDHHDINARCWSSVRLNGICESDENCVIAHSSCINKRCVCDEGFHETRDKFCSNAQKVQISFLVVALVVFTSMRLF
ncbi:unnamed protein product [Chironomus riparius]|uniref:EB domain-containing protein n=1 Tax=Chironomus riparius TaxID=315576 RepID=A0A9P0J4P4_9DIPT|nr:unnamed protein product [Chironomus riparius]